AGTTGSDIGFEVRTPDGMKQVSFPMHRVGGPAWLDIVGEYNRETLRLFCNRRFMDGTSCSGPLQTNGEPLLIGAETDGGVIARPFSGQMEEVAIFDRALSDAEIAMLCRTPQTWTETADIVHHRQAGHPVGDFRPHYVDSEFVVSYLYNPGTWNCAVLRSTDLLNWTQEVPTHAPPGAGQEIPNYFMLSFIHDPQENNWRTFYGYAGMRASTSDSLSHWTGTTPHLLVPNNPVIYDR